MSYTAADIFQIILIFLILITGTLAFFAVHFVFGSHLLNVI